MPSKTSNRSAAPYSLSHSDLPRHSLPEALQIPSLIYSGFGLGRASVDAVAKQLGLSPTASGFKSLIRSAKAYDILTESDSALAVTERAREILLNHSQEAKRSAIRRPRTFDAFLAQLEGRPITTAIAVRAFESLGLAPDKAEFAWQILRENLKDAGALVEYGGDVFIDMTREVEASGDSATYVTGVFDRAESPMPARSVDRRQTRTLDGGLRRSLKVDAYHLVKRLGSGFSAEVWSARVEDPPDGVDLEPGSEIAVKFFHPHVLAMPDQVIRIEREYRIASKLRHPHLIRIYEFLLASSRPHHNFVVMDMARGQSLRNLIPPTGLIASKALQITSQLLDALDELHAAGALHRDVKPGNIAVADDHELHATLLDLGIVSVAHERSLTVATRFLGSKHWAPYEQLVGQHLDVRSDLYSLAAVVYNMLTATEPYAAQTTEGAVVVEMLQRPIRLPESVAVPGEVRELMNACLSTDIRNRPRSAAECLEILRRHIGY